jgi:extracellular elastinolytic metalloproteinase
MTRFNVSRARTRPHRWRLGAVVTAFCACALTAPLSALGVGNVEDHVHAGDVDNRTGTVQPTPAQQATAQSLGATVRWNRFGTPHTLIKHGGFFATGLSGDNAVEAARSWIGANRALFRLSAQGVAGLQAINDAAIGAQGHAVQFRQRFGELVSGEDGLITVGVVGSRAAGWNIGYVSSSAAGDGNAAGPASLTPQEAWVIAAASIGRQVALPGITNATTKLGWTQFEVAGFSHFQRARLRAVPTPSDGVRPAYETHVTDSQAGHLTGHTVFVDAQSGDVLTSHNNVQNAEAPTVEAFSGSYGPHPTCGVSGPFTSPAGTQTITVGATSTNPVNDIVLDLYITAPFVAANHRGHSDTGTSPEAIAADVSTDPHPSQWFVTVCPFTPSDGPDTYEGVISFNSAAGGPDAFPWPPKWKFFKNSPLLDFLQGHPVYNRLDTDIRIIGCWNPDTDFNTKPVDDCQMVLENTASRAPWDHLIQTDSPSFTTTGNNAISAEAWMAAVVPPPVGPVALGPGPFGHQPTSPSRDYVYPWRDRWNNERCSQTAYTPLPGPPAEYGNDVDPAAANLFVMHNRMHDWSYHLGFTEKNFNLQINNFGLTPQSRQNDPEVGSVQAGAISGAPGPNANTSYAGRNNANQLTLNDGVPGLTNMYLWQPRAASFYAACADGDYDMSVIGHEYAHAIQNRMVGGPDAGLSGHQARAMGESWSDLTAVEYLNEYGFAPVQGENPFSVGAYVTGHKIRGIRNYGMNDSPLNYSDVEYDNTGSVSPHADGEIWSATNFVIRQLFVAKYDALGFPASNATLQRRCADGQLPADQCPGNRRWIQLVHDAFLLMPGAVSMVDARDAMLAADQMRSANPGNNWPSNQTELWRGFAQRGLGQFASSTGTEDRDPVPSFESLVEPEAAVTFQARAIDEGNAPVRAKVFVGRYEARARPIADTDSTTSLSNVARFVPGTYEFIVQADGYGHLRFTRTFTTSATTVTLNLATNYASQAKGGAAFGEGGIHNGLIDDTEATNWVALNRQPSVAGTSVTVDLAGGTRMVRRVQVSAMLRPLVANDFDTNDDPAQPRFSGLRKFEIWVCTASAANANCSTGTTGFSRIFASPDDAFPGVRPRPVAPELLLREFDVPDTHATHVQLRVVTNQCTGGPGFQDEQDADPVTTTDCEDGSAIDNEVRAAELQAFASASSAAGKGRS